AGFVIAFQIAAIMSTDTLSRLAFLKSEAVLAHAPDATSLLWWPARAVVGDLAALAGVLGMGLALLAGATSAFSKRFGEHALAASSAVTAKSRCVAAQRALCQATPKQMLRRKEWMLLWRDPWLLSQTLMQMLYLLPPALMLWRNFGDRNDALVLLSNQANFL